MKEQAIKAFEGAGKARKLHLTYSVFFIFNLFIVSLLFHKSFSFISLTKPLFLVWTVALPIPVQLPLVPIHC
jgi:hypothetical protein